MNKVYWSHCFDPNHWKDSNCGVLTVLLIPKRWWSFEDWKFSFSLRARFLEHMAKMMNEQTPEDNL